MTDKARQRPDLGLVKINRYCSLWFHFSQMLRFAVRKSLRLVWTRLSSIGKGKGNLTWWDCNPQLQLNPAHVASASLSTTNQTGPLYVLIWTLCACVWRCWEAQRLGAAVQMKSSKLWHRGGLRPERITLIVANTCNTSNASQPCRPLTANTFDTGNTCYTCDGFNTSNTCNGCNTLAYL